MKEKHKEPYFLRYVVPKQLHTSNRRALALPTGPSGIVTQHNIFSSPLHSNKPLHRGKVMWNVIFTTDLSFFKRNAGESSRDFRQLQNMWW